MPQYGEKMFSFLPMYLFLLPASMYEAIFESSPKGRRRISFNISLSPSMVFRTLFRQKSQPEHSILICPMAPRRAYLRQAGDVKIFTSGL